MVIKNAYVIGDKSQYITGTQAYPFPTKVPLLYITEPEGEPRPFQKTSSKWTCHCTVIIVAFVDACHFVVLIFNTMEFNKQ